MVNLWGSDPSSKINIRESNDYIDAGDPQPDHRDMSPWVRNIIQPLIIGIMVACIAIAVIDLLRQALPEWRYHFFLIAPVMASYAGYTTQNKLQKRFMSGTDSLKYQVYELVVIFILCKAATHLNNTFSEFISQTQQWFSDPKTFFDSETIAMFLLSFVAWMAAAATAIDLHKITDPTLYVGEKSPIHRLSSRFFAGGMILLITTAFARVRFMDLLQNDQPRVPGLILNVLLYFILGLLLIGQLNYIHLTGIWRRQKVHVENALGDRWIRYSLLFLVIILSIAFVLPTAYTVGLLDIARFIIGIAAFLANLLFYLLSYPFLLLISLLFKDAGTTTALPPAQRIQPPEIGPTTPDHSFFEIARSIIFWLCAFFALGYVIKGYLRDRPNLLARIARFKPMQWLVTFIRYLASIWRRVRTNLEETLPRIFNQILPRRKNKLLTVAHKPGSGLRHRIMYEYLHTLDIALDEGIPRNKNQTPHEYGKILETKVPEIEQEWVRLTRFFIEARYSKHQLDPYVAEQAAQDAKKTQEALKSIRENLEEFENS